MNLRMGGQTFSNIQIPLLWGTRAIIQDQQGRLSIIDLGGDSTRLEIVGDKPAPGIEYVPSLDGFEIMINGKSIYRYNPGEKILTMIGSELPECQISRSQIRVGTNIFSGNTFSNLGIGIFVTGEEIGMGAPLPSKLARLLI
jgi:hypothetical protein